MKTSTRPAQRGFTLIEVLLALLVFAVGILTVAGLQIVSKKSNYDAVQRTTATLLAQDIIQRMRANDMSVWDEYLSENLGGNTLTGATACDTSTAVCSPQQMAAFDLQEWEDALDGAAESGTGGLVDPSACIRGPVGGGEGTYNIIIAWRGVTELSNPTIDAATGATHCGAGEYGENDAYRRVLMVTTFIAA